MIKLDLLATIYQILLSNGMKPNDLYTAFYYKWLSNGLKNNDLNLIIQHI